LGGIGLTCSALSLGGEKASRGPAVAGALHERPRLVVAAEYGVGRLVPDLALTDIEGKSQKLSELQDGRIVVVAMASTTCPISRKFAPTLARLEKTYSKKNVIFVHVDSSSSTAADDAREPTQKHGYAGPCIRDRDGTLARALGATHTTDVFVLDARRTVVYRGAIDDQYGQGYALDAPRREFLVDAIEATLRGARPNTAATLAPGCPLEIKQVGGQAPSSAVTYHGRISRLLQTHCVECHHRGGSAPFSLEDADSVHSQAAAIQSVVERGIMPPWFAVPTPAGEKSRWSNDRTLPLQDKTDLLGWLAGGKPDGDAREEPLPGHFPDGWQIGEPDLIVQIPKPIAVNASGAMPYQDVTVDTKLTSDKWVQALEVQPTDRNVVHHVLVFMQSAADAGGKVSSHDDLQAADGEHGLFASYVPGNAVIQLPDDFAKLLPAKSRLRFQIHYNPNGTATRDQMRLGMVFAKKPPKHVVQVKGIVDRQLNIPPGADNHAEAGMMKLAIDMRIMAFMPHMHLRGKAFRYEAVLPDGKTQLLLDVPRYDPNWQLTYRLAEPIELPKGTVLRATGWFDNSRDNPGNPDPGKTVHWGPQADEEMLIGFIEYYAPKRLATNAKGTGKTSRPPRAQQGR
jgi:thiol-disulfide isomerase/thioredoxin